MSLWSKKRSQTCMLFQHVSQLEKQSRTRREKVKKSLTTSPRKDAVRIKIAPNGNRTANAKPMMEPCAITALERSGLTSAHTEFTAGDGHGQDISIAVRKVIED